MRKGPIVLIVCLILGWWGISMTRSLSSSEGSFKVPAEDGEGGITNRLPSSSAPVGKPESASDKALRAQNAVPIPVDPPKPVKPVVFEQQSELNSYAALITKVLPTPEEKAARANLVKDARLIRAVGARLVQQPLLPLGEQDIAIDLLVEALQSGDKSAASEAIGAIVADGQVEDPKIPIPVREQLGGMKGELMYHWTALEPGQTAQLAGRLPGNTSRQIWANVQEAQRQNLAESAREAGR